MEVPTSGGDTSYVLEYATFIENLQRDLSNYLERLTAIETECQTIMDTEEDKELKQLKTLIHALNSDYKKYGSDYFLPNLNEGLSEELKDLLEEIQDRRAEVNEILLEIEENADEAFEDLFEDFLDEFKTGQKDKD